MNEYVQNAVDNFLGRVGVKPKRVDEIFVGCDRTVLLVFDRKYESEVLSCYFSFGGCKLFAVKFE